MKKSKISISLIGIAFFLILAGCSFNQAPNQPNISASLPASEEKNALPIPPLLEDQNPADDVAEFYLKAQKSTKAFFPGVETETFGYNGDYLGPVIKVKKGDQVKVHIENGLGNEDTTVHWHGLEVPGNADGGPHSVIKPNETFTPSFTNSPHHLRLHNQQQHYGIIPIFFIRQGNKSTRGLPVYFILMMRYQKV